MVLKYAGHCLSAFLNSLNPQSYLWIGILISKTILKIMKQEHREVKGPAQDHTAYLVRGWARNPIQIV